ncbi:hypothetical protein ACHAWT_000675 [Skeletonema menzelii]
MRSRSISPSTSIRSHDSDSDDSDDAGRYAGMTEEQLNEIWERRNLAYFDRRQRKLAEEEQQQQQQQQQSLYGDGSVTHGSSPDSSASVQDQLAERSAPSSSSQRGQQQQPTQPAGYLCAADSPAWREFTSRNAMGEFDAERASRDPAYLNAWTSCERLVNMNRSGATAGNFIPTNPRLAALLEHQRLEMARVRYEEEAVRRQHQPQSQGGADQHHNMMVDDRASREPGGITPSTFAASASIAAQQAAEYERLSRAHRLEQARESYAHAQPSNSPKSSTSGGSAGEKSVTQTLTPSYYMALPNPTPQLTKSVICGNCNLNLYTAVPADSFFCQTCGAISATPSKGAEETHEEKMYDVDDQDFNMSYY